MGAQIFHRIALLIPGLNLKMRQAGMAEKPEDFVKKSIFTALLMTGGIFLLVSIIFSTLKIGMIGLFLATPLLLGFMIFYFLQSPDVMILKRQKEISREIVFAGRFLIIELESGVSLYNAMRNVAKSYDSIGLYFREIIGRIDMGTSIEDAINESVETTPSPTFRKVLWQVLNSLKTGADVSKSLNSVVEQITQEQIIEIREYGRKLTPFAMFYMILAVILPSIGVIMLIVLSTFIGIKLSLGLLMAMEFFLGFFQFMFYSLIKSQRPMVEL